VAKFLKLIEKLLRRPPEAHFKDIIKVLENFGWKLKKSKSKGSHYVYYKEGYYPFAFSVHKNKVKRSCIIELIDVLELEEWFEENKK
jgi:predicted RNA binding protein YcfA (HicA-like mRNA interferase family)